MKKISKRLYVATTTIAIIAISWYLLKAFSFLECWWALPATALATGIFAAVLPFIIRRFSAPFAIISTGLELFIIQIMSSFTSTANLIPLCITIFIIAILTEIATNSDLHFGTLILDVLLSLLSAWIIIRFSKAIATLIILFINYLLVILVDFDFKFSIKGRKTAEPDSASTVE